jgi:hypothetical protein
LKVKSIKAALERPIEPQIKCDESTNLELQQCISALSNLELRVSSIQQLFGDFSGIAALLIDISILQRQVAPIA